MTGGGLVEAVRCLMCRQWWATDTYPRTSITCRFCPDCIPTISRPDTTGVNA